MKICFVSDNRDRDNWGCRATSIALKEAVAERHEVIYTIYGNMTFSYDRYQYEGGTPRLSFFEKIRRKIPYARGFPFSERSDFISEDIDSCVSKFLSIYKDYAPLQKIYDKISECEGVVINGEGTFIYTTPYRYDSSFFLFILALAQHLGKKTYLLNAMFSPAPDGSVNQKMIGQSQHILGKCSIVTARDPLSLQFYKDNILPTIHYVPDALFLWQKYTNYFDVCLKYPLSGIPFHEMDEYWKEFDFSQEYICVSGGSLAASKQSEATTGYIDLVKALKKVFPKIILLATCAGDRFLKDVAKETNTAFIPVNTNIIFGLSVLSNAKVFVSGRWHPSIMASLNGTPCIFLKGNSHKCLALQYMLDYPEPHEYSCIPDYAEIDEIVRDVKRLLPEEAEKRKRIREISMKLSDEIIKSFNYML